MQYIATITNYSFRSVPNKLPAVLDVWITTENQVSDVMLEFMGSVKGLSQKFHIDANDESNCDFAFLKGCHCRVQKDNMGYHILCLV